MKKNELHLAASPYLLQHAHQPVQWVEWGPRALERAAIEKKPLLISIGYAACHWCHVMARESFMDSSLAALMNEHFICIKVDREERPDIDQIYMEACQLLTGRGGWPLNAFALADGRPFYAVSYLPPSSWRTLLERIIHLHQQTPQELEASAESITQRLIPPRLHLPHAPEPFGIPTLREWLTPWSALLDDHHGGFGHQQKFPLPVAQTFLLEAHAFSQLPAPKDWVLQTIDKMALGGIHDQIGGGFFRYSVDPAWKVPHFEKMLYDNAQLTSLYAQAHQLTRNPSYGQIAKQTLSFLEREMGSPTTGFFSSLNADSEGQEGIFYTWTEEELRSLLPQGDRDLVLEYLQIKENGNWEEGRNILLPLRPEAVFALQKGMREDEWHRILDQTQSRLMQARDERTRPSRDEKILTAWNALMISAYTHAARAFAEPSHRRHAVTLGQFILTTMKRPDGGLRRSLFKGVPRVDAFLDDYAFFIRSLIDLYTITFDKTWLDEAAGFTEYCFQNFYDPQGGFFFYSAHHPIGAGVRLTELDDQVTPSSNSVMAHCLLDLGRLLEKPDYLRQAEEMARRMIPAIKANGPYTANWARLFLHLYSEPREAVIMGEQAGDKALELQQSYQPFTLFAGGPQEYLPILKDRLVKGKTILYRCRGHVCQTPEEL